MEDAVRLRFSKTGKAKYMSHLDLMSTMQRALLRAGVSLVFSKGFNPHPHMSIALPLPTGCGSLCELMDVSVAGGLAAGDQGGERITDAVNAVLPEGLAIIETYAPERKFSAIAWVQLSAVLYYDVKRDAEATRDIVNELTNLLKSDKLIISKKTKSGVSDIDLAHYIRDAEVSGEDGISIKIKVSAKDPTINPENILSALSREGGFAAPDFALFTRSQVYDADLRVFR